jgi:hypothetical protein
MELAADDTDRSIDVEDLQPARLHHGDGREHVIERQFEDPRHHIDDFAQVQRAEPRRRRLIAQLSLDLGSRRLIA